MVSPTYSRDQAAIKIQTRARMMSALHKVRILYQISIMTTIDETSSDQYYYNPMTGVTMWQLPSFMDGKLDHVEYKNKTKKKFISANKDEIKEIVNNEVIADKSSDNESDHPSENSDTRKEKRRLQRSYPR